MNWTNVTKTFIVLFVGFGIVFDIFLAIFGGQGATISLVLQEWSRRETIIAFAFGVLMGHLFWQNPPPPSK